MELLFCPKLLSLNLFQPNHSLIEFLLQLVKNRVQNNKNKLSWMNSKLMKTKQHRRQQKLMQLIQR
jgi:hypothetical protein